jgi:hypothetical protein
MIDDRVKLIGKKVYYLGEICKIISFDGLKEQVIVSYTYGWPLESEDKHFYNFENLTIGQKLHYVEKDKLKFYDIRKQIKELVI